MVNLFQDKSPDVHMFVFVVFFNIHPCYSNIKPCCSQHPPIFPQDTFILKKHRGDIFNQQVVYKKQPIVWLQMSGRFLQTT